MKYEKLLPSILYILQITFKLFLAQHWLASTMPLDLAQVRRI
jgi:hypothetical protein